MKPKLLVPFVCLSLFLAVFTGFSQNQAAAQTNAGGDSMLLTVSGSVEVAAAGTSSWKPGTANQVLKAGDRIKTGKNSRATVRLSNLSILRVFELTTLEIQPPAQPAQNPGLDVKSGSVYFFNRDKPQTTQFRTPAASGAIRGTEFNLAVAEDGRMLLTLVDGEVDLQNELGSLELKTGEQAMAEPGKAPQKTASVDAINVIQWTLYYPGVLDVNELGISDDVKVLLAPSLDAYRMGDLLKAVDSYPWDRESASAEDKVYRAALSLAAGKVDQMENLLQNLGEGKALELGEALKMLVAAVKNQKIAHSGSHSSATAAMASSYYHQSLGDLEKALEDAKAAAAKSPDFGFAHARVAELEFSFGRTAEALAALDKSLSLSPRNAQSLALQGFLLAAQNKISEAQSAFERAIAVDGNLGNAWLGRGLTKIKKGHVSEGRKDIETAASLEPNRALFRSYLGKAWSMGRPWMYSWDQTLATKELNLAKELDPNDPTSWLYSALLEQSRNNVNAAVEDLEHSQKLNDNRRIFRSKMLLDQDRAVRSANLASVYRDVGMIDYSVREASRAVEADPLNFSGHLFLSDSYAALLDPKSINLRYETAWLSELLIANLFQPVGAGNLSQNVSQQEYSKLFETDKFGVSSATEYWSEGSWHERASQYGTLGNSSYALDIDYRKINGNRPNNDVEDRYYSFKFKQQITAQDSVFVQVEDRHFSAGDILQYYNNNLPVSSTNAGFFPNIRYHDVQEPNVYAGYRREWSPENHTLILAGRLDDVFDYTNSNFSLFGRSAEQAYHSETPFWFIELQQIVRLADHTVMAGGRFQHGDNEFTGFWRYPAVTFPIPTSSGLVFVPAQYNNTVDVDFQRYSFYAYDLWQICDPLQLTAGLSYDHLRSPENSDIAPLTPNQKTHDQISPKVGIRYTPWENTTFRAAYTRSMSGMYQDTSYRLEPSQISGFTQAYRSIGPESVLGTTPPGTEFTTYGIGVEQVFKTRTYLTLDLEILESDSDRVNGVVLPAPTNAFSFSGVTLNPAAFPTMAINFPEQIKYRERSVNFSAVQLLGDEWSVGIRYRISKADYQQTFPTSPSFGGISVPNASQQAVLNQSTLFGNYNHRCGFFARGETVWFSQSNTGYSPDLPGDNVWQFNLFAGYRFPRRQAEVMVGLLNLTDEDYSLNPLNYYIEYPRDRILFVSAKFNF